MTAQPALPWEELDEGDGVDEVEARWLSAPGLLGGANEGDRLRALIALADEAASTPSKFLRLARLLTRLREPVIVFSEFRDTIEACLPYVQAVATVVVLHGGLDAMERGRLLRRFLDGHATVLLATDVAGEGLNLQQRARVVITLEWPWSPHRLEQRIGRVDRLGQSRRVHAFHLTAAGTFEETVVARLLERRARARRDLDEGDDQTEHGGGRAGVRRGAGGRRGPVLRRPSLRDRRLIHRRRVDAPRGGRGGASARRAAGSVPRGAGTDGDTILVLPTSAPRRPRRCPRSSRSPRDRSRGGRSGRTSWRFASS